jgi:hypothetical protein
MVANAYHSSPQLNMASYKVASRLYLDAFDLNRKLRLRLFRYKTFSGNHFWCNRKSLVYRKCRYGQWKIHPIMEKRLNSSSISAPSPSSLSFLTSPSLLSLRFFFLLFLSDLASPLSRSICFLLFHTNTMLMYCNILIILLSLLLEGNYGIVCLTLI